MADEPSDKQPENLEQERAAAPAPGFDPDWEWHRRAHPVAVVAWPAPSAPEKPRGAVQPEKPTVSAPDAKPAPPATQPAAEPAIVTTSESEPQKPAPPGGGSSEKTVPPATGGAPPKPPAPPKEAPPKPEPLGNDLVKRFKERFGEAVLEAWIDRKQAILVVAAGKLREIALYARDEEKFDLLSDLTAVDWLKREKRFDVILNLYSFAKNERLRLKAPAAEDEKVPSVTGVWGTANWLERECYDMFGIVFDGHPDLRRILLPDEWQGHPLRKDYDILTQDTAWVRENLGIESGQ
jgi:NADH-quinone oxidoreductase subunit C